MVNETL